MRYEIGKRAPRAPLARSAAVLLRLRRRPAEEGCEELVRGVPTEHEGEGLADHHGAARGSGGDMRQEPSGVPARGGDPRAAHRVRFLLQELLRVRGPGGPLILAYVNQYSCSTRLQFGTYFTTNRKKIWVLQTIFGIFCTFKLIRQKIGRILYKFTIQVSTSSIHIWN